MDRETLKRVHRQLMSSTGADPNTRIMDLRRWLEEQIEAAPEPEPDVPEVRHRRWKPSA